MNFDQWLFGRHDRPRHETVTLLVRNARHWNLDFAQFATLFSYVSVRTPTIRTTIAFSQVVNQLCMEFGIDVNSYEEMVSPRSGFGHQKPDRGCCVLPFFSQNKNKNKVKQTKHNKILKNPVDSTTE